MREAATQEGLLELKNNNYNKSSQGEGKKESENSR